MSIRSVQTKYRAAASFPVLTTIDTNSPVHQIQDYDRYFGKPTQPSFPTTTATSSLAPSPVFTAGSANRRSPATSSTLSPYASPYKPRSAPRSSAHQAQNQYGPAMERPGARVGRAAPAALDADFVVKYPQASSPMTFGGSSYNVGGNLMDSGLSTVPTYSHTSRFDPFGDFSSAQENTTIISIPSQPLTFSSPTPSPASTKSFTQTFGAGTGHGPAYTHFYYYDKATNSPTLAYGSQQSNKRNNYNHNRNQWNHKAKPNNNNNQPQEYRRSNNKSFTPSRSPSRSPSPPSPSSFYPVQSPISRSPSPPSPKKASFSPSPVAFPPTSVAPLEDPFADPVPVPVRTRKRSNTISEVPKAVQQQPTAPVPSISPPLPEPKPKVSEKSKADSSLASRLVAAMLLNRVDATGRSRCGGSASKRLGGRYVKSGLSRVVFVEC